MNREIKFRVWDINKKIFIPEEVYGFNGYNHGLWKFCRRPNHRLAEIERQIKELEAERDKIKSKL